jgi:hypothetical protein
LSYFNGKGHLSLAHADVVIVVDVVREVALLLEVGDGGLHHLVEDVVGPLHLLHTDRGIISKRVTYFVPVTHIKHKFVVDNFHESQYDTERDFLKVTYVP